MTQKWLLTAEEFHQQSIEGKRSHAKKSLLKARTCFLEEFAIKILNADRLSARSLWERKKESVREFRLIRIAIGMKTAKKALIAIT